MKRVRRNPWHLALLLILAGVLSSCRDSSLDSQQIVNRKFLDVRTALSRAEVLMESDPHAARAVLDSIAYPHPLPKGKGARPAGPPSFRRGKGEAAHFAWLKVQTDYKCYVPLTSDTLARIATDYYGKPRHKDYHAAMAWYTLGCVYTEMQNDPKAVDAYLTAHELFPDTVNRYYVIALFNTGKHYLNRHMYAEAESRFLAAKNNPYCKRDSLQMAYTDFNLGLSHMYQSRFRHAEEDFYAVLHNPYAPPLFRKDIDYQLAKLNFYESKDCATSLSYVNRFIAQAENPKGIASAWVLKGNIMAHSQQYDSAYACYQNALACHTDIYARNQANKLLAHISQLTQKNDSAEYYSEAYQSSLDSIYNSFGREEIDSIRNTHRLETLRLEKTSKTVRLLSFGIVALLVAALLLWALRKRRHSLPSVAPSLPHGAAPSDGDEDSMTPQERAARCRERFQQSALFATLVEDLRQGDLSAKMNQARRAEIRKAVADATSDIRSELMIDCPLLTREDLEYCEYMLSGFSIKTMAECTTYSEHALESRKSRIKNKVSPAWKEILFSNDSSL
ncbi:MAG: tetratricopeptide repeat protein [Bacteroidaceae bacterium]|nr:tetratricopeptide repeat protein [Bacteroidaceae bacterium]